MLEVGDGEAHLISIGELVEGDAARGRRVLVNVREHLVDALVALLLGLIALAQPRAPRKVIDEREPLHDERDGRQRADEEHAEARRGAHAHAVLLDA